jgi:tetrahydromethanopterin S-methyltransferase subunit G
MQSQSNEQTIPDNNRGGRTDIGILLAICLGLPLFAVMLVVYITNSNT